MLTINVEIDEKGAEEGILTTVTLPHPAASHQDLVEHVRDATVFSSRRCSQIKQCVMHCMYTVRRAPRHCARSATPSESYSRQYNFCNIKPFGAYVAGDMAYIASAAMS